MKKLITIVLAMVLVICMFAGCGSTPENPYDPKTDLAQVPGYDYLYYSVETRTVFYLFEEGTTTSMATGYMSPYILNGHFCEYVDGEIVEVIPTVRIEEPTE